MTELTRGKLTSAADMLTFALAGNATLTLVSEKTGTRYTFRVRKPKKAEATCPWFVSVMYGPDNETQFSYLGTIFPDKSYRHGRKSNIPEGDVREKAFLWLWVHIVPGFGCATPTVPPSMEVWHEGRCCRCGSPVPLAVP